MIYVDTSVLLAQALADDRRPPPALWAETLVSSRLAEYETWTRLHARGLGRSHGETVRQVLARVSLLELSPTVLSRALDPFPVAVRTLDAMHLASIEYLRSQRLQVQVATYDRRMRDAARALDIPIAHL